MANEYKSAIEQAVQDLTKISEAVKEVEKSVVSSLGNMSKAAQGIFSAKNTPNEMSKELERLKKQVEDLNGKLVTFTATKAALNQKTSEEIVNQRALAKASDTQAKSVSKLVGAYQNLVAQQQQAKKALQDSIVLHGQNNKKTIEAQRAYDSLTKKVNMANKATSNFANTGLGQMAAGFRNLIGAFGIIGGATLFANIVRESFSLITTLDSISFSIKAVIKDNEELAQTQDFLKQITNDYGAELVTTTNRYIKFRAAAEQANLSAKDTQDIFGTMTKAAGVLGLKTDELQGIFLALEQMISKGKITTEELRRQLGERLPGAMDIMADSMGVTTSELDKMLKAGQVISKDVLPGFARQVEIAFGLNSIDKVQTLRAATTRLRNAWTILVDDFRTGNTTTKSLMNLIDSLAKNLGTVVKIIVLGTKVWLAYKAALILANVQQKIMNLNLLQQATAAASATTAQTAQTAATTAATGAWTRFNTVLKANYLGIAIAALYGLYKVIKLISPTLEESFEKVNALNDEFLESSKRTFDVSRNTQELLEKYDRLKVEASNNKDKQKELKDVIQEIVKIVPQAKTGVDDYGNALDINREKVVEFTKENAKLITLQAKKSIRDQNVELGKYRELLQDINVKQKTGEMINTSVAGSYKMIDGVLKRVISKQGQTRNATLEEQAAYEEYILSIKKGIRTLDENIEMDKIAFKTAQDLINGKSILTKETDKETDAVDESRIAVEKYNEEIAKLIVQRDELKKGGITIGEEKEYLKILEDIADLEAKRDAILGKQKGTGSNRNKDLLKPNQEALKSAQETEQARLKIIMDNNQAIMDDEQSTVINKILASQEFEKASNDSAISRAKFDIAMATLAANFIIDSTKATKAEKEKAADNLKNKLLEIETELEAAKNANRLKGLKDTEKILSEEFKRKKKSIDDQKELDASRFEEEKIRPAQKQYEEDLRALNKQLKDKEISEETYNELREVLTVGHENRINQIKRDAAIENIKTQIKLWEELIKRDPTLNDEEKREALKNLADYQAQLSEATLEDQISKMEEEEKARELLLKRRNELIGYASDILANTLNLDSNNIKKFLTLFSEGFGNTFDEIADSARIVTAVIGDVFAAVHDRNIEKLDEEIQENRDYYTALLDNALLSEEQRDALEAQRDAKEAELEKKKREERKKAAKTEKLFAIADIGIKLAQTIVAINLAAAAIDAVTFGIGGTAYRAANLPLAIGLAAAQVGAILAQPIPEFYKGTENAPQGWAMVDEKRPEVHLDRYNRIKSFGEDSPNLRYLEKGDKIVKSRGEFAQRYNVDDINKAIWELNLKSNGEAIRDYQIETTMINTINGMRGDMESMGRRFEKIAKRPINNKVTVEIEDKRHY